MSCLTFSSQNKCKGCSFLICLRAPDPKCHWSLGLDLSGKKIEGFSMSPMTIKIRDFHRKSSPPPENGVTRLYPPLPWGYPPLPPQPPPGTQIPPPGAPPGPNGPRFSGLFPPFLGGRRGGSRPPPDVQGPLRVKNWCFLGGIFWTFWTPPLVLTPPLKKWCFFDPFFVTKSILWKMEMLFWYSCKKIKPVLWKWYIPFSTSSRND